jgi:hypothetical protein
MRDFLCACAIGACEDGRCTFFFASEAMNEESGNNLETWDRFFFILQELLEHLRQNTHPSFQYQKLMFW